MFSWWLESLTAAGFVGLTEGDDGQTVAPYAATEGLLGTNPIGFGFPSSADPVIWDSGTSAVTYAEVELAGRLGNDLPEDVAFGPDGAPTTSPADAPAGVFAVWGGAPRLGSLTERAPARDADRVSGGAFDDSGGAGLPRGRHRAGDGDGDGGGGGDRGPS